MENLALRQQLAMVSDRKIKADTVSQSRALVLGIAVSLLVWLPSDTVSISTRYLGALAPKRVFFYWRWKSDRGTSISTARPRQYIRRTI